MDRDVSEKSLHEEVVLRTVSFWFFFLLSLFSLVNHFPHGHRAEGCLSLHGPVAGAEDPWLWKGVLVAQSAGCRGGSLWSWCN